MATTNYSYAQVLPGFFGQFNYLSSGTKLAYSTTASATWSGWIIGTSAVWTCGSGSSTPYSVSVE